MDRLTISRDLLERIASTDIDKLQAEDAQEWTNLRIRLADAKWCLEKQIVGTHREQQNDTDALKVAEAVKAAEDIYLASPILNGPCSYDEEYFWRAIMAFRNFVPDPTLPPDTIQIRPKTSE
jgi:hypothetical protein